MVPRWAWQSWIGDQSEVWLTQGLSLSSRISITPTEPPSLTPMHCATFILLLASTQPQVNSSPCTFLYTQIWLIWHWTCPSTQPLVYITMFISVPLFCLGEYAFWQTPERLCKCVGGTRLSCLRCVFFHCNHTDFQWQLTRHWEWSKVFAVFIITIECDKKKVTRSVPHLLTHIIIYTHWALY